MWTSQSFSRHIWKPCPQSLNNCLPSLLLTHFDVSSKMNLDKQHLSRNSGHTYWSHISTIRRAEQREEKPRCRPTRRESRKSSSVTLKRKKKCQVLCHVYVQSGKVPESYSSVSVAATDNFTIVSTARQLHTHGKNVSLHCFLYTKRCLFHSCWANTGPSYDPTPSCRRAAARAGTKQ